MSTHSENIRLGSTAILLSWLPTVPYVIAAIGEEEALIPLIGLLVSCGLSMGLRYKPSAVLKWLSILYGISLIQFGFWECIRLPIVPGILFLYFVAVGYVIFYLLKQDRPLSIQKVIGQLIIVVTSIFTVIVVAWVLMFITRVPRD